MNENAVDGAILNIVHKVWTSFDVENSGVLSKDLAKNVAQTTLKSLDQSDDYSEESFDIIFASFDKDGAGKIKKAEMVVIIKRLLYA